MMVCILFRISRVLSPCCELKGLLLNKLQVKKALFVSCGVAIVNIFVRVECYGWLGRIVFSLNMRYL
jgi:hypothetical protein